MRQLAPAGGTESAPPVIPLPPHSSALPLTQWQVRSYPEAG